MKESVGKQSCVGESWREVETEGTPKKRGKGTGVIEREEPREWEKEGRKEKGSRARTAEVGGRKEVGGKETK